MPGPVDILMNKTTYGLVAHVVLTAGLGSGHALSEDATCKLVFDATEKSLTTPNHSYVKLSLMHSEERLVYGSVSEPPGN
jgi:hypothetical protein